VDALSGHTDEPKKGEDPMATMDNLQDAFAGESQANRKYLAFAKKADQDGFSQVAKLFRPLPPPKPSTPTPICASWAG